MIFSQKKRTEGDSISRYLLVHINQITSIIKNFGTFSFKTNVNQLKFFLESNYQEAFDSNQETNFIDELFVSISLQNQTPLGHLCLLDIIIDVNLGDKIFKANKMMRDIINLPPEPNPIFWSLLGRILIWLEKTLRSSIQLILHPLRENMWKWCSSKDTDILISGLRLLRLFLIHFPVSLEEQFIHVQTTIIDSMNHLIIEVRNAAKDVLISGITIPETSTFFGIVTMCARFNFILSEPNWKFYESSLEGAELIISNLPEMIGCFTFNSIPLIFLNDREIEAQISTLKIIPFIIKSTPALLNEETNFLLLKEYKNLISKKTNIRKFALISFSQVLFLKRSISNEKELKILTKCRKIIIDSFDLDICSYFLISLSFVHIDFLLKDLPLIFSKPLNDLMIEGFKNLFKLYPDKKNIIQKHIISIGTQYFLQCNNIQQIIYASNAFISLELPIYFFPLPLLFQFSSYLFHQELQIRKSVTNLLLYCYNLNNSLEIAQLLLLFLTTETENEFRLEIVKKIANSKFHTETLSNFRILIHDLFIPLRNESLKFLAENSTIESVSELLNNFLVEKISILENTPKLPKENIECFLIIGKYIFSKNPNYFPTFFFPFVKLLITKIISFNKKLPKNALLLLALIIRISPTDINLPSLVSHINHSLSIDSSKERIDSALNLLLSCFECTDLLFTLFDDYPIIISKLINLGKCSENSISRLTLLKVFSVIGIIKPQLIQSIFIKNDDNVTSIELYTVNYFITKSESNDPYSSLIYSALGVSLTSLLNILFDESLLVLHHTVIESLLTILKTYRQIGKDLEKILLKQLNNFLSNGDPSTVSILLSNMTTLIAVLGKNFEPLIPHVIDFICNKWNKLDHFQLIRITEWLISSVPQAIIPFFPLLTDLFLSRINHYNEKVVDAIFSVFISFGENINSVIHILLPTLLNWIVINSTKTLICNEILTKLRSILINCNTQRFSSQIIGTMILIGQNNKALHERILDIFSVSAFHCEKQFLFFIPRLASIFDLSLNTQLQSIINSLENDSPINSEIITILQPVNSSNYSKNHSNSFSIPTQSRNNKELILIKQPILEWDEGQWLIWMDETFSYLVKNSSSRAISACRPLIERHSKLKETLLPLAFVLYYIQVQEIYHDKMYTLFDIVFQAISIPRSIILCFLSALEIMEVLGLSLPVRFQTISDISTKVGVYPQSLRASEVLFDRGVSEMTEKLITLNQSLGLPLAANGILRTSHLKNYSSKEDILAEKLGLCDDSLKIIEIILSLDPKNPFLLSR